MAVSEKAVQFLGDSLDRGRPIPGQSLTNPPEQPYNWESPTEFTNPREAMLYVFETLTIPETIENTLLSLSNGVGVVDIASIVLYSGFLEGKWNPDLMTLLMEPTMYMIIALAEKAEVKYVLESGDTEQGDVVDNETQLQNLQSGINELDRMKQTASKRVSPQSVPEDVREVIEKQEIEPSLLEKVQQGGSSLLSKGE
tara:strand:+ start:497 stop:1090 length:594 start_codon:yes stop_codon:yes gene_type:complete